MSYRIRTSAHPHIFSASIHSLNLQHNTFHLPVITFCVIRLFEVTAEEESDGLPEACSKSAFIFLDDIITIIARLTIDKLHQNLTLVNGQLLHRIRKFFFQVL